MREEMKSPQRSGRRLTPFNAALIYLVLGGLWIVLSDRVLETMATDPQVLTRLQTYKGELFVLITAVLFYVLIRRATSEL